MQEDYSQKIDIELKWEKYKNEKLNLNKKGNNLAIVVLISIIISCIVLILFYFFISKEFVRSTWLIFITIGGLIGVYVFESIFVSNEDEIKKIFFKHHREEIMPLVVSKTMKLEPIKKNDLKPIYIVVSSPYGVEKQIVDCAIKTEKGIELKKYIKDNASKFYFQDIKISEDDKPRVEMKNRRFASENLKNIFREYSLMDLYYLEYTFYLPEENMETFFEKICYKGESL
ncbi:hypothetical protein BN424_2357 [Carnobacterium maltaromaticum LMA28]|uniref:Uncharacterized protein n=1 Tax=Carnobacterium maltaromaticum LMA28 TaxID=1234679 RepID=K8E557_CARML|nr:hypothetical protein [Carnobacterium maltaromaticum]CCO11797.2 hypothetical protein BN424_2357 [Carnobacterium maltaromaticum LMA28]